MLYVSRQHAKLVAIEYRVPSASKRRGEAITKAHKTVHVPQSVAREHTVMYGILFWEGWNDAAYANSLGTWLCLKSSASGDDRGSYVG